MKATPKVSVIMPVYNVERYVREAIDSILTQTIADLELIVINDGSTDGTVGVVRSFVDPRLIFIDHSENKGNYPRRNEGTLLAQGEVIAVMDGDDIAHPERLEKQLAAFADDPALVACGTAYDIMGYNDRHPPVPYGKIRKNLRRRMCFLHSSMVVQRDAMTALGGYDEYYKYAGDYDLACRLALYGKVGNLPHSLMRYRIRRGQISSAYRRKQFLFASEIAEKYKRLL
jgi:glycosyltransferase involved in cell wall biosynthesis